jgi:hypothetical protein
VGLKTAHSFHVTGEPSDRARRSGCLCSERGTTIARMRIARGRPGAGNWLPIIDDASAVVTPL